MVMEQIFFIHRFLERMAGKKQASPFYGNQQKSDPRACLASTLFSILSLTFCLHKQLINCSWVKSLLCEL